MPNIDKTRGDQVKISVTIKNTGTVAHNFPVGASIRAPNGFVTDLPYKTTGSLQPGSTTTLAFFETLGAATGTGVHTVIVAIWTSPDGGNLQGELARNTSWTITVKAEAPKAIFEGVSVT